MLSNFRELVLTMLGCKLRMYSKESFAQDIKPKKRMAALCAAIRFLGFRLYYRSFQSIRVRVSDLENHPKISLRDTESKA